MISKELLSKVLGINDINLILDEGNEINYTRFANITRGSRDVFINKYELAHKCKEWAYNNKYVLDCFSKCIEIRKQNEEDIIYIERGELFDNSSHDISLVFKACQWILENKATN